MVKSLSEYNRQVSDLLLRSFRTTEVISSKNLNLKLYDFLRLLLQVHTHIAAPLFHMTVGLRSPTLSLHLQRSFNVSSLTI